MSRLDHVLASINGALADHDMPDAMRWTPQPQKADAPHPYDGQHVPLPPQRYEHTPWADLLHANAWAAQMGSSLEDLADTLTRPRYEPVLPLPGPAWRDPAAHALTLRQTRSTGPDRPSGQTARRPRRHQ